MEKNLGIYIHIPFCAGKCAYCDFYSCSGCDDLMPGYQAAVLHHIAESAPQLDGYLADTVYFGGGTPSYYGASRLISIFGALKKHGNVLVDSEVTVEINPESANLLELILLRKAGFNRLSIGVQSANDGILKSIGRLHDFAQAEKAMQIARKAGFGNINLDLIYGLPSQTKEDWADTLGRAAALKPEHFSCYGLEVKEGTALYPYKGSPFIPDDDTQADMYLYTVEALERFGYKQYEISNFAMRGFESRHNTKYWTGEEYMGFGAAAHSYVGGNRYSYISDIKTYSENIMTGKTVVDHFEEISRFERAGEYLLLSLRTTRGISEKEYFEIFPCSFDMIRQRMEFYVSQGWALYKNERWSFTPEGFLLSNVLIGEILDTQTKQRTFIGTPWKRADYEAQSQYSMFYQENKCVEPFSGIF